jgi:hypothetical protein
VEAGLRVGPWAPAKEVNQKYSISQKVSAAASSSYAAAADFEKKNNVSSR